jgi:hypothetical protein
MGTKKWLNPKFSWLTRLELMVQVCFSCTTSGFQQLTACLCTAAAKQSEERRC